MKLKQIRVDGYKNLINCVVDLGDFNVLVGPNNSGKSNLLEVLQMLWGVCFGSDKTRGYIIEGMPTPGRISSWVCHLDEYSDKPLRLGVQFEEVIGGENWKVDYDFAIENGDPKKGGGGFLHEGLKAKVVSKPGPMTTYLERNGKLLKILGKQKSISLHNSSFNAIASLYPDYKGLPKEMGAFIEGVRCLGGTKVLALWPDGLRKSISVEEKKVSNIRVTSFDPLIMMDEIKESSEEEYELFRETVGDILDLDNISFFAGILGGDAEGSEEQGGKRFRLCQVQRAGSKPADVQEFSDGTFAVIGVVAAFLAHDKWRPAFCLEEPENCLHPAALEKLLRFLQDNSDRWPVLITTHSPYLLNGVNPEDVRVAVVDDKTGAVHFEKVKNSGELRKYLNKGLMSFGELLANNYDRFRE